MDAVRKDRVLKVLEFWELIEFLGQTDIKKQTKTNKDTIDRIRDGLPTEAKCIYLFREFGEFTPDLREQIEQDGEEFPEYEVAGNVVSFVLGKIARNDFVDYLEKYVEDQDRVPDLKYPKDSEIAWFTFRTNINGVYEKFSFRLSPLIWAATEWERNPEEQRRRDFSLNRESYKTIINDINKELQGKHISEFLDDLYTKIKTEYVSIIPNLKTEFGGSYVYGRCKVRDHVLQLDKSISEYADMGRSFFEDDIRMLKEEINDDHFGDRNAYEEKVVDYVLSAYEKSRGMGAMERITISDKEDRKNMRRFFEQVLDVKKAPLGKWPAKFMPALMQQVAVNIAIDESGHTPIFSVNGPPGTGKTTLLKEIIASNIVKRAILLANIGENPDDAFERKEFEHGPLEDKAHSYYEGAPYYYALRNDRINDYGMLVTSCNNAAVENITMDLPKGEDILDSLDGSDESDEEVRKGLDEVRALFDVEQSRDEEEVEASAEAGTQAEGVPDRSRVTVRDIYFTRYANAMQGRQNCWGLVSAPFGKKDNINKYCKMVLNPFLKDYKSPEVRNQHRKRFVYWRTAFLKQLKVVQEMQEDLEKVCALARRMPDGEVSEEKYANYAEREKTLAARIRGYDEEITSERIQRDRIEIPPERKFFNGKRQKALEEIENINIKIEGLEREREELKKEYNPVKNVTGFLKLKKKYSAGADELKMIDAAFLDKYFSKDDEKTSEKNGSNASTEAQGTNPWFTARYNREREKLFLYACKLHKEFVISSECMRKNIMNLLIAWKNSDVYQLNMNGKDKKNALPVLLQSIFLLTPVISSTFAAAQNFLRDVQKPGVFGTLIVDESGQAQPQMAVGALYRCRKAMIVGDPKQIEPVVTAETDMIKNLLTEELYAPYKNKQISVQGFADYINPFGTFLGAGEESEWVGCPLVVHRRCIDPMYTISNQLSYDMTMKQKTGKPKEKKTRTFILEKSCWINVTGKENPGAKDHFVRAQGEVVLELLKRKREKMQEGELPKLFIITPFTSVKFGMEEMLKQSELYEQWPELRKWMQGTSIGTVHTFQGQGTDEVIFLLGCDKDSTAAANWVNKNIVNVAATRAKFRFYMIGDKEVWSHGPVNTAREITVRMKEDGMEMDAADLPGREPNTEPEPQAEEKPHPVKVLVETEICSKCKKRPMYKIFGPKGPFFGCSGYPKNCDGIKFVFNPSTKRELVKGRVCEKCGLPLYKTYGKNGPFISCGGYPECDYTEDIK